MYNIFLFVILIDIPLRTVVKCKLLTVFSANKQYFCNSHRNLAMICSIFIVFYPCSCIKSRCMITVVMRCFQESCYTICHCCLSLPSIMSCALVMATHSWCPTCVRVYGQLRQIVSAQQLRVELEEKERCDGITVRNRCELLYDVDLPGHPAKYNVLYVGLGHTLMVPHLCVSE